MGMVETIMDKAEIKEVNEWCEEKGHSEHEILELIRRIVGAKSFYSIIVWWFGGLFVSLRQNNL